MPIEIRPISPDLLDQYIAVPIVFTVRSRLRVDLVEGGLGGIRLVAEQVDPPYRKDYDLDETPADLPSRFDVRNWAFLWRMMGTARWARRR